MSYISDYLNGYIDDEEFKIIAARENRQDRWEREHEYEEGEDEDDEG